MSKKDKVVELKFEGDLTIQRVAELKDQLVEALDKPGNLTINLKDAGRADLTFLQLLCSTHRTAQKAGKVMILSEVPQNIDNAVTTAGFVRDNMSCGQDCSEKCLWMEN